MSIFETGNDGVIFSIDEVDVKINEEEANELEKRFETIEDAIAANNSRDNTQDTQIASLQNTDITIAAALEEKQDTLIAGTGITIAADGKTISADAASYTAGNNIQITGNVISATDTTYTAGSNVSITDGVISATDTVYTLPIAGANVLGGVKVGSNLYINDSGVLSAETAQVYTAGTAIDISNNVISVDATDISYTDLKNKPTIPSIEGLTTKTYVDNADAAIQSDVDDIEALIPSQATTSNQLADKSFVNSSIQTATATFRGTYNTLAELEAVSADENDYGFVISTDSAGNTIYNRYKYANSTWTFEYALNNSSFTAAQWGAINSGITSALVSDIALNSTARHTHSNKSFLDGLSQSTLDAKQDTLTAGTNITISNNVISATGGGGNITSGTTDLVDGVSTLATGTLYCYYTV